MTVTTRWIIRCLYALLALLSLAAALMAFPPFPARAEARPALGSFTVRVERPFGGWINADMAREAAQAAARREVAARAAPGLAQIPELAEWPALAGENADGTRERLLELMARLLLEPPAPGGLTRGSLEPALKGASRTLALEQRFRLGGIGQIRQKLALLLSAPALLENCRLVLQLEQESLARYDAAVEALLSRPEPARRDRANAAAEPLWLEAAARHDALRACGLYLEILPALYGESGLSPELLEPLEEINRLSPGNYLFLSELGRLYLWLERSGQAGQVLEAALRLNPNFDQAYGHRGALWLLLHKPALALADFDRAIRLAAGKPEMEAVYRHGRAVVWKALGNSAGLCEDLRQSCLLGQCAAYEWAVAGKECPAGGG